jgi:hypothetical protein
MTSRFDGSAIFQFDLTQVIGDSMREYIQRGTEGIPKELLIPTKYLTTPLHVALRARRWRLWGVADMNRPSIGEADFLKILMVPTAVVCDLRDWKYVNTVMIDHPVSLIYHFFYKNNGPTEAYSSEENRKAMRWGSVEELR